MPLRRFKLLAPLLLLSATLARANTPGGGDTGPDVTLSQRGTLVTLANGILTATINTANATVTSLKYRGHDLINTTGRHHTIYFSRDGGAAYENLSHCAFSITTRTPDTIDISCKHTYTPAKKDKHAWDVDAHFVLRRGASGLYTYLVCSHPASYPDLGVSEWRMVWSTPSDPRDVMEKIYVDTLRHWVAPLPSDFRTAERTPIKEISKMTQGTWAGRYDCKYMYSANYGDLGCWGFASDRNHIGGFVVFGSHEFFNDGPTKNDLTAAVGTTLVHFGLDHYNGSSFKIKQGEKWEKIYGPYLIYLNSKPTGDEAWADAQEQAKAEESAWPYKWMNSPLYPLDNQRGTVDGKLVITDPLKPNVNAANAWVGVIPTHGRPTDNWQFRGDGYQYWTRAHADGSFAIPHVRPGEYTLFAFNTGAVGEFKQTDISVTAGHATDLHTLTWTVPHHGRHIAWEIGIPDRSAAEFLHGNDYYLPYLYKTAPQEITNPLDFTIGKSDFHKDWLYVQSRRMEGDKPIPQRWRIHFTLPTAPAGPSTLTLAIASAQRSHIEVFINSDAGRPFTTVTPEVQGGNALLREGIHAKYCVLYVPIPAGKLTAGENTITLVQNDLRDASSHVMYDYLNLETP